MFESLPESTLDRRTPLLTVALLAGVLLVQVTVGYRSVGSAGEILVPACLAVFGLLLLDAGWTRLSRRLVD